ncbi:MAG: glycosyltransferase family 4 protein [Nocardioides sp.]|nr:glycosyltransferase family 4 protein [Nocardioides sp.]
MRVALLSYRSKPHCGGQGIYIRHLSRELTNLGHSVEVFSGQPYPELDEGVALTKLPSLDLYREPDPFRVPKLKEFRDRIDVEEFATMCGAGFPEPKTFSLRAARALRDRVEDFDIVHDNQVLGYGLLEIEKMGLPLITTLHHPITFDRRIDMAATRNPWRKFTLSRWYGFLRMQGRVARQARRIMTPSETSKRDIVKDFGVDPERMQVILLGVDDGFVPPTEPRVPGRILAMASADAPMKGISTLLEAFAKLRTERDLELLLVTKPTPGGRTERLIDKLSIGDAVRFVHGVSDAELVEACATPLVVSRAGAIPEVVGPDGLCADLVSPGDVGELTAAIAALLDDPERRERYGAAGRRRVEELFSWRAVAQQVAAAYEDVIADYRSENQKETTRADR